MQQRKQQVKLKIMLANSDLQPGESFDLDVEVLLISESKPPFFQEPVLLHLLLQSSHHLHSATTKPLNFNQILSLHKKVQLPMTGGCTRIVQPFRLKIPNRALPATFQYRNYGYEAQTSYSLQTYLTFEQNLSERLFESNQVALIVRQFAQIDKQQNMVLNIPEKCWCFRRSKVSRTELQIIYDKMCYYFQSDYINCRISYIRSDQDLNASSIGGVNKGRQISPSRLTAQFMFELMELKVDERKIQHSVKIGRPLQILWDGTDNQRLRVPLGQVFLQNCDMKFSQSCSGQYFSCKWYLLWEFTFPGNYTYEVKTRIWLQTRDFKPLKPPKKRISLKEPEQFYQLSEEKKLSRQDVAAETSSLGSFIRRNTQQNEKSEPSRLEIPNIFSDETQYASTSSKKVKSEKQPLLLKVTNAP